MKILMVVSTLSFGGAERAAANISRLLSQKHNVSILTLHNNTVYPYAGKLIDLNVPYNPNPNFGQKIKRFYYKSVSFRRIFKEEKPDVVLSFTEGPNLISILNKITGLKGTFIINTQIPPSRVYRGFYKYPYTILLGIFYRYADKIIALSEGVKTELIQKFNVPAGLVNVIHNPIDYEMIHTSCQESVEEDIFHDGVPVVLNVGRIVPQKNQVLLIRAFRRVRELTESRLVILGTGPLESQLRILAEQFDLKDDVHFLGWRSNPFKYMNKAAIFVLSSDYEGFGNVLVEAMACGCPVIATDCHSGPAEILKDGEYGVLVPVGDEESLAKQTIQLLADSNLRQIFSAKGLSRAKEFDIDMIGQKYEETFEIE
jgi:glycosyltransferase involved in cell wall biosynthesis